MVLNAECLEEEEEEEDGSFILDKASERLREIGSGLACKVNGTRLTSGTREDGCDVFSCTSSMGMTFYEKAKQIFVKKKKFDLPLASR